MVRVIFPSTIYNAGIETGFCIKSRLRLVEQRATTNKVGKNLLGVLLGAVNARVRFIGLNK